VKYLIALFKVIGFLLKELGMAILGTFMLAYMVSLVFSPFIIIGLFAEGHPWLGALYCAPLVAWLCVEIYEKANESPRVAG
jgi:hypothetical protein